MIRWTAAGAVPAPQVLQVRVRVRFPGRVRAGAPVPSRALTDQEVAHNVRYFTVEQDGPRATPCTALVLSGVRLGQRPGLAEVVREARRGGIRRVTLHLARGEAGRLGEAALGREVDALAAPVGSPEDAAELRVLAGGRWHVTAVVPLVRANLGLLPEVVAGLVQAAPDRVVFTWPFPPSATPPSAPQVAQALQAVAPGASSLTWGVKGLPACALGPLAHRLWRSGNRFYVDADHQRERALLFFPDVVRFARAEACRFCSAASRCDGAPEPWLKAGLAGVLRPMD